MNCKNITLKRSEILELEMDLTGVCNLKCPLCTRNYAHAQSMLKKNIRPLSEIIKQLESFENLELFYMAGNYSEPTLYPHIIELCHYLVKRGIAIELFTNGSTHDENFWRRLGSVLSSNDQVFFTICGSTQELHEKYRVGSRLSMVLQNHKAFKEGDPHGIDRIQHIKFEYNAEDLKSDAMREIIERFSGTFFVETEGRRMFNNYKKEFNKNEVRPEDNRKRAIDAIFANRAKPGDKNIQINCMSLRDKKIYIDQFGQISPCYGHAEFEGPGHFKGDIFDYGDVLEFKFKDCFKCERRTQKIIEAMGLDFVC